VPEAGDVVSETTWEQRMAERAAARAAGRTAAQLAERQREHDEWTAGLRASLPPALSADVCGHGIPYGCGGFGRSEEPIAWAGGVGHCECCRSAFGYIGSMMVTFNLRTGESQGHSNEPNPDLCPDCGGVTERREW
jgi:hypothetical protein